MAGGGTTYAVVDKWVGLWCSMSNLSEAPSLGHSEHVPGTNFTFATSMSLQIDPSPQVSSMNISGTLNVFRLIRDPALCLPQHIVPTFNHLPIPLSKAFAKEDGRKEVDIRAVVLDKDNCFAVPHSNEVHKPYNVGNSLRSQQLCTFHSRFMTFVPSQHVLCVHSRHCHEYMFKTLQKPSRT